MLQAHGEPEQEAEPLTSTALQNSILLALRLRLRLAFCNGLLHSLCRCSLGFTFRVCLSLGCLGFLGWWLIGVFIFIFVLIFVFILVVFVLVFVFIFGLGLFLCRSTLCCRLLCDC